MLEYDECKWDIGNHHYLIIVVAVSGNGNGDVVSSCTYIHHRNTRAYVSGINLLSHVKPLHEFTILDDQMNIDILECDSEYNFTFSPLHLPIGKMSLIFHYSTFELMLPVRAHLLPHKPSCPVCVSIMKGQKRILMIRDRNRI